MQCFLNRHLVMLSTGVLLGALAIPGCAPDSPESVLKSGMDKLEAGNYRGAVRRLERAAKRMPESATARANLGVAYWKLGQAPKAVGSFRKAAELAPRDPRPHEFAARVLLEAGRAAEARDMLDYAFQRGSPSARLLTEMGVVQLKSGQTNDGISLLQQALVLDPAYAPAIYNLAFANDKIINNKAEAVQWYDKYLQVAGNEPKAEQARRNLAAIPAVPAERTAGTNKPVKAEAPTVKKAAIDPLVATARNAIQKEAYDEALVMLNRAIKKNPKNADALWELAELYDKHLNYRDSAEQMKRKFDQLFPDDPRARKSASSQEPAAEGGTGATAGDTAVTTSDTAKPKPADIKAAEGEFRKALKYHKAQDYERAIEHYKRAMENDGNYADAAYNMGLAYKDSGKADLARENFLYALSVKPEMAKASYMLAVVYIETQNADAAIEQLKRVIKVEPDNAKAHYLLGIAYKSEFRIDEAKKHFQRYIELEPAEPSAREARDWLNSLRSRSRSP